MLTFGGDTYVVVGRQWNDAMIYVMTKENTDLANDTVLLVFVSFVFILFIVIVSAYGIIINRDNIVSGKRPSYITLHKSRDPETGEQRNTLNFNITVAKKLLPITLGGIIAVTALCFYTQSVNSLSSIAYESNKAISEIGVKLENNTADAGLLNEQYKEMFLESSFTLSSILEETPELLYQYDREDDNVHALETSKDADGETVGLDENGNTAYVISEHPFLQELCQINSVERIYLFRSDGRPLALSSNDWWFALSDAPEDQSYDFYEILADHTDYVAQDMGLDDEGNLSQYIGAAYFYYTYVDPATGETRFASRSDYEAQMKAISSYAGGAIGPAITKHRGVLEVSIAPERLRSIAETATLDYVADHTTIHGTGHTVICDTSEEHRCIYSPREADIGKTAAVMGTACFLSRKRMYAHVAKPAPEPAQTP